MAVKHGGHLWVRHPSVRAGDELTRGERAADVMRNAFGSWAFVGGFLGFMAVWMIVNSVVLGPRGFDKFPYILLNLSLSMMAGLQGALILIAAKRADRVAAEQATAHYHETSKIDSVAGEVLALQKQQMNLLAELEHVTTELRGVRALLTPTEPLLATQPPADPAGRPAGEAAPASRRPRTPRKTAAPKQERM